MLGRAQSLASALQVWYSVPAHASEALEDAVRDALPHLFETAPDLLYQLVTMVSPKQLQVRQWRLLVLPCSLLGPTSVTRNHLLLSVHEGSVLADRLSWPIPAWILRLCA